MADAYEYFGVGSIVRCKSVYEEYEGEVLVFDDKTRMLILKISPSNRKENFANIYIINLNMVTDVQVKKECKTSPSPLPNINFQKLNCRMEKNVAEKQQWINAYSAGVSTEGRNVFQAIAKTLDEVSWQGANIVVMKNVIITPPYHPENVKSSTDYQAQAHVKKIVRCIESEIFTCTIPGRKIFKRANFFL